MYLTSRFYIAFTVVILVTGCGHFYAPLFTVGQCLLVVLVLAVIAEALALWTVRGITATRECDDRFSNGDDNPVRISLESRYRFTAPLHVIDEIPHVFQRRDVDFKVTLPAGSHRTIAYTLRPTERGVYGFGRIRVFASTLLSLLQRRFTLGEPRDVKVYPSYLKLNRYALMAMSDHLVEVGVKRIRRAGNNTEFEQIKDYVKGDEYRAINWKASARRHQLMVNVYQDERSQQVFQVIDKGRVMQQAFNGMTLLDYAINASLVLSYVAVHKDDKAGIITFDRQMDDFVPAERRPGHMTTILDTLYGQTTEFSESDYSSLCVSVNRLIGKRSLLVLYTQFTSMAALKRQLPYLRQLNNRHRLLVVFFEDAELQDYVETHATSMHERYQHVIAQKIIDEKQLVVTTLRQNGIQALLTTPEGLTVDVINKYLEIKKRQLI